MWAIDFQFDQTQDGHNLKLLHVVDEFTREALAIECHRRIDADKLIAVLDRLVAERATAPAVLRCAQSEGSLCVSVSRVAIVNATAWVRGADDALPAHECALRIAGQGQR